MEEARRRVESPVPSTSQRLPDPRAAPLHPPPPPPVPPPLAMRMAFIMGPSAAATSARLPACVGLPMCLMCVRGRGRPDTALGPAPQVASIFRSPSGPPRWP